MVSWSISEINEEYFQERSHKEYESTPISIGGGITRKEDPRQSSSATEKSFVGDTSSTESSDVESKSRLANLLTKKNRLRDRLLSSELRI